MSDVDESDDEYSNSDAEKTPVNSRSDNVSTCEVQEQSNVWDLKTALPVWKIIYNISMLALGYLLNMLRLNGHEDLPKDPRTLMQTPRQTFKRVIQLSGGKYIHLGIRYGIETIVKHLNLQSNIIKLNFHIDGLPLAKSSKFHFWTIMGAIISPVESNPFMIGTYYGKQKPNDSNSFLFYFASELKQLIENGLVVSNQKFSVVINAFICDAPALAFIKRIIYFNGYHGCTKCIVQGEYIGNRMVFNSISSDLRTDISFREQRQPAHHKGTSTLQSLPINMVDQFPVDYLHAVCLGVGKRLVKMLVKNETSYNMQAQDLIYLSDMLIELRFCIPDEFARVPRSIFEVKFWKATESRQFILYTGIMLLKQFIPTKAYTHFLCFSVAIRILCDPDLCYDFNNYAENLLKYFVANYSQYCNLYITYNVHNLIHLPADVRKFGTLDQFSAFPFENEMQNMKNKISPNDTNLEQLFNRTTEQYRFMPSKCTENFKSVEAITKGSNKKSELHSVVVNNLKICSNFKNDTLMLNDNSIVKVLKIMEKDNDISLLCKRFDNVEPLFLEPLNSLIIGVCVVNINNLSDQFTCSISAIKRKMVKLPYPESKQLNLPCQNFTKYILFPLLHH